MADMVPRVSKALIFVGLMVIYASLVVHRPLMWRGSWSFDVYDVFHWVGVAGAVLFVVSTSMGVDAFRARLSGWWTRVHCSLGVLAFAFAAVHARTKAEVFLPVHYSSLLLLVLLGVLAFSGAGLRFLGGPRYVRLWGLLHEPVSAALKIGLLHHVLVKLAVI